MHDNLISEFESLTIHFKDKLVLLGVWVNQFVIIRVSVEEHWSLAAQKLTHLFDAKVWNSWNERHLHL